MPKPLVVKHAILRDAVGRLRDQRTSPAVFRGLVNNISLLLVAEATRQLTLQNIQVDTPLTTTTEQRLTQRIGLVPILRAGLGMVDAALRLLPAAEVWHLGIYRDERTAQPVRYYDKLAPGQAVDLALVLDPMLATGGSIRSTLATLAEWGVENTRVVSIISAQPGIDAVQQEFPNVQIYTAAIDPELNDQKFIVPGLGDAGDRMFGTE